MRLGFLNVERFRENDALVWFGGRGSSAFDRERYGWRDGDLVPGDLHYRGPT